jgi:cobaltochelatase CobS
MSEKAWLKTNEGFQEINLLEESSSRRTIQLVGGEEDGITKRIFGEGVSHGVFYPALFKGPTPPANIFEFHGKWIPVYDPKDFSKEHLLKVPEEEKYIFQPHTADVLNGIIAGDHQLLFGQTGAGKTSLVMQIAARIGMPVIRINMTEHTMVSDIIGSMGIRGSETVFNYGPLIVAMKFGLWCLIDEGNFIPPPVQSVLFSVAESPSTYTLKENDGEVICAHPRFRLFVTANNLFGDTDGVYAGTQAFNRALLGRFAGHGQVVQIMQMTPAQERNVVAARVPALPNNLVKRVVVCAQKLRDQGYIFSTREVVNWARKMLIYRDAVLAAQLTFVNILAGESESDPKRQELLAILRQEFGRRIHLITKVIVAPDGKPALVEDVDDPTEEDEVEQAVAVAEDEGMSEEDVEEKMLELAKKKKLRTGTDITDEVELRIFWKNYKGNGGRYSYKELEQRYALVVSNGSNGMRCVKKYEKMMAEKGEWKGQSAGN